MQKLKKQNDIDIIILFLSLFIIEWFNSGVFAVYINKLSAPIKYGMLAGWIFLVFLRKKNLVKLIDLISPLIVFLLYMFIMRIITEQQRYINIIDVYTQNFIYLIVCVIMSMFYLDDEKKPHAKVIIWYITMELLIISANTYAQLLINPDAARLYTARAKYADALADVNLNLFGSFNFFYGILPYMLLLIYFAKKKIKHRSWCLVLFGILYFIAVQAAFSIVLLITIVFIIVIFLQDAEMTKKQKQLTYIFLALTIVLISPIISQLFYNLSTQSALPEIVRTRALEIYQAMNGIENTDSGVVLRGELYMRALQGFIKSPIWGICVLSEVFITGGHSTFQDLLACFGIFNILFYIFLHNFYKVIYNSAKPYMRNYVAVYFVCYIVLCFLNPMISAQISLYWYIFIPLICKYIGTEGEYNENTIN